jgi:predicted nucleic acid-binding protein
MPDKITVCNTTPLIALSKSGGMWFLKEMYGKIYVPQAVWDE